MTRLDDLKDLIATPTDECIIWPYAKIRGYGEIFVDGRVTYAHRWVCIQTHGPSDLDAAHECGVPACVNPRHLNWKTRAENMADRARHGTRNNGERNGQAKLTASEVADIRRRLTTGEMQKDIAADLGVRPETISKINTGARWS